MKYKCGGEGMSGMVLTSTLITESCSINWPRMKCNIVTFFSILKSSFLFFLTTWHRDISVLEAAALLGGGKTHVTRLWWEYCNVPSHCSAPLSQLHLGLFHLGKLLLQGTPPYKEKFAKEINNLVSRTLPSVVWSYLIILQSILLFPFQFPCKWEK